MKQILYRRWTIECDPLLTAEIGRKVVSGGADSCGCGYCQIYAAQRDQIWVGEMLDLLGILGIDFRKEVEVYELGEITPGTLLYGGWFHFVGRVDGGRNVLEGSSGMTVSEQIAPGRTVSFRNGSAVLEDPFKGHEIAQLQFQVDVRRAPGEPIPACRVTKTPMGPADGLAGGHDPYPNLR